MLLHLATRQQNSSLYIHCTDKTNFLLIMLKIICEWSGIFTDIGKNKNSLVLSLRSEVSTAVKRRCLTPEMKACKVQNTACILPAHPCHVWGQRVRVVRRWQNWHVQVANNNKSIRKEQRCRYSTMIKRFCNQMAHNNWYIMRAQSTSQF